MAGNVSQIIHCNLIKREIFRCFEVTKGLCRVLSVDPASKRVEVTLKTDMKTTVAKSDASVFCNLHVSDVISGQIKRIEPYGLFIAIDNTNMVNVLLPCLQEGITLESVI